MRKIYLIRHCKMEQAGPGRCISQTDLPLSRAGIEQAEALKAWASDKEVSHIFTSPLKRCTETAAYVSHGKKIKVLETLTEISVGEWEGITFSEIKERWPLEYRQRGMEIGTMPPPGGESFKDGGERLEKAVLNALGQTEGNLMIVTHSGILRGWLCKLAMISVNRVFEFQIPCGSITELCWDGNRFSIDSIGVKTVQSPGEREIKEFYEECHTPENVRDHCMAVAKKAMELSQGTKADITLLHAAALLHDLCRADGRDHPVVAAKKLAKAGYERLSLIVEVHRDLPDDMEQLRLHKVDTEAEILYLADKLIRGTKEVSIEKRFEDSRDKCQDEASVQAWKKRFEAAKKLEKKYI